MNKVILFVVTLLISCQTKESNTSYHDEPVVINCDSIKEQHIEELKQYTVSIPLSQYSYSDQLWKQLYRWLDRLPISLTNSLLERKLLINKKYYLSNIILDNEYKIDSIYKLNTALERSISQQIGLKQGLPTVLFSTSINSSEEENKGKQELLILEINSLLY